MSRTRVKICGICSVDDAAVAVEAGADALGLVFYAKSPRCVSVSMAREIVASLQPFVTVTGLFVNSPYKEVYNVISRLNLDLLQFHGDEDESFCNCFDLPYIKAVRVQADTDLNQSCQEFDSARGLLLDSFRKNTPGGTGETFDWSLIPKDLPLPVILAGGLNSNNVQHAIRTVRPWAVDVSSGVEQTPGIKDPQKIADFFSEIANSSLGT